MSPSKPDTTDRQNRHFTSQSAEQKRRITLPVIPSLYDDNQKIAYVERRSVSELLSAMMEEYRGSHAAELAEYEEIQR